MTYDNICKYLAEEYPVNFARFGYFQRQQQKFRYAENTWLHLQGQIHPETY